MKGLAVIPIGAGLIVAGCMLPRNGTLDTESTTISDGGGGGTMSMTGGGDDGQGGGGIEDCLDGIDNNGDQLADCADPQCTPNYECVPEAPTAWLGYSRIARSAYPGPVLTCSDGSTPDVYFDTPGEEAQCSACECGPAVDGGCSYPQLSCWFNTNSCNGMASAEYSPSDGGCKQLPDNNTCSNSCNNPQVCAMSEDSKVIGSPSCVPSGGAPKIGPAWNGETAVCTGVTGGGCNSGSVCVATGQAPFDSTACITRDGQQTCPDAYPITVYAHADGTDTRGCSDCDCDSSSLSCLGASITVYDNNTCGGSQAILNGCTSVKDLIDNDSASYAATNGSLSDCAPGGGAPTGAVTPTDAITICCR